MVTNEELPESRFIQEGIKGNPYPFWFWLFMLVIILSLALGLQSWYGEFFSARLNQSPFMQVTNRKFSLFLWQNPEFMRSFSKVKSGYLSGFNYIENVTMEPGMEDQTVIAPPEVIFRYHTWARLVKGETPPRKIDPKLFISFLQQVPEWSPEHWKEAPEPYRALIQKLPDVGVENLQELPKDVLPDDVRIAFIGWLNFYYDQEAINAVSPTFEEMQSFLEKYPHFARNFWKNIISDNYLKAYTLGLFSPDSVVSKNEMASFLRAAFYNETHVGD